ncbi:floral homeotic protein PMADS 2-like [Olea europaea var. sylvestris]|uniref:floral homeotic protein PMADS 2-like n=1 Tax=Olea europaea var. sylvestris TaxID=158386 RepID=UPI000C1D51E3|nr:floral homeotic protein PMADS 2-like [Olea europaea var. sylvestris]
MVIEEALENGLISIRDRQMEHVKMLRKNEKMLEEENNQLQYELQQRMAAVDGNVREINDLYIPMPFAVRVQPIQPDLHERI